MKVMILFLILSCALSPNYPQAGHLDDTFGQHGIVTTEMNVLSGECNVLEAVLQSDGKVVVAGSCQIGDLSLAVIARYNPNGSFDNTFGINGIVRTSFSQFSSAVIQSDGKIVAGGFVTGSGNDQDFALARFKINGALDSTFGFDGKVITSFAGNSRVSSVALQNNGKIVAGGYTRNGDNWDFAIARYNVNGGLDNTFGTNGIVLSGITGVDDFANSVAIQSDDKIIAAGELNDGAVIARYNPNGILDNSFGNAGIIINVAIDDGVNSVALQDDGKIVCAAYYQLLRYSSNGIPDSTFDEDGMVTPPIGLISAAILTDGKIISAGAFSPVFYQDFAITRHNADGSLDSTFGTNGKIVISIAAGNDYAYSTAIQSNGKIVAVGTALTGNEGGLFALAGFNSDGSPDNEFGNFGVVTTPIGDSYSSASSLAIQADGKIVVAGTTYSYEDSTRDFALIRYNTDGTPDNTFGTSGIVNTSIGSGEAIANSVNIQSDGKIVVAGGTSFFSFNDFALARYNSNGFPDNSFGLNGIVTTPINNSQALSAAIQNDGKIIAAGYSSDGSTDVFTLARYNSNGSLDNFFGTNGIVITSALSQSYIYSVAIQNDGKIIAAGYSYNPDSDFTLARYTEDGNLDTTFGVNGIVISPINNSSAAYSSVIQDDGKIIAAGSSYDGNTDLLTLARYNSNGDLDNSFGLNGIVNTEIEEADGAYLLSIAIGTGEKIVAAGFCTIGDQDISIIVRYNPDGSLDSSFGTGGIVITPMGTSNNRYSSVAVQDDGKIVAAGNSNNGNNYRVFTVARYNGDPATSVENEKFGKIPASFSLNQNYPNPFNPSTTINYQIPEEGFVTLKFYNTLGEEVKTLVNENKSAGNYNVQFEAGELSSGIYIYQIRVGNPAGGGYTASKKLMLVK